MSNAALDDAKCSLFTFIAFITTHWIYLWRQIGTHYTRTNSQKEERHRVCVCVREIYFLAITYQDEYIPLIKCVNAPGKKLSHTLTHRLHRCTHKSECVHTKTFWVTKKINKNVKRDKNGNCVYVINVYLYFYTLIRSLARSLIQFNVMWCDGNATNNNLASSLTLRPSTSRAVLFQSLCGFLSFYRQYRYTPNSAA